MRVKPKYMLLTINSQTKPQWKSHITLVVGSQLTIGLKTIHVILQHSCSLWSSKQALESQEENKDLHDSGRFQAIQQNRLKNYFYWIYVILLQTKRKSIFVIFLLFLIVHFSIFSSSFFFALSLGSHTHQRRDSWFCMGEKGIIGPPSSLRGFLPYF